MGSIDTPKQSEITTKKKLDISSYTNTKHDAIIKKASEGEKEIKNEFEIMKESQALKKNILTRLGTMKETLLASPNLSPKVQKELQEKISFCSIESGIDNMESNAEKLRALRFVKEWLDKMSTTMSITEIQEHLQKMIKEHAERHLPLVVIDVIGMASMLMIMFAVCALFSVVYIGELGFAICMMLMLAWATGGVIITLLEKFAVSDEIKEKISKKKASQNMNSLYTRIAPFMPDISQAQFNELYTQYRHSKNSIESLVRYFEIAHANDSKIDEKEFDTIVRSL